jgi:hypothetical protein
MALSDRSRTNAGILVTMAPHRTLDLFRIGGALATPQSAPGIVHDTDRRQFLRDVQTDIEDHCIASDGESHRATVPGARHYRQVSHPPRLLDIHTNRWPVAVPRQTFAEILSLIARLQAPFAPKWQ